MTFFIGVEESIGIACRVYVIIEKSIGCGVKRLWFMILGKNKIFWVIGVLLLEIILMIGKLIYVYRFCNLWNVFI